MLTTLARTFSASAKKRVVLMPGDGIGPEITEAVIKIFDHLSIPIEWEHHKIHSQSVTEHGDLISQDTIEAIQRHGYGLKGPFTTPIGKGHRSLNVTLRKRLKLYANVRPCVSIPGVKNSLYEGVNLVTIRENTEGEYSGLEHVVVPGIVENLKIITQEACDNIVRYAFEYATRVGRSKITCCHKADVMKLGDGCFAKTFRRIAKEYPHIEIEEKQIDTMCTKLVKEPEAIDVMVMPNLYGDIVSDLCAGLIGGLGLTPSGNIGKDCAVYEAVHGSAPDIAGKGLANPTALLLSGAMMLEAMAFTEEAKRIQNAVNVVIGEGQWSTRDLGGKAGTDEYVRALLSNL